MITKNTNYNYLFKFELFSKILNSAKLSGGQQRRLSLACALIHDPPLIILDEPTVGTDPMLRRDIWLHLQSLCMSGHTIIVTTHYIEEARNANTVAFMRNGILLAEEDPQLLLVKYESTNLEDVFLKLCDSNVGQLSEVCPNNHYTQNVYPKSEQIIRSQQ